MSGFEFGKLGPIIVKDPQSLLDYAVDWTDWLGTDDIISVVWTVQQGIQKIRESNDLKTAKIELSGGSVGEVYSISCRITTGESRVDERTFRVHIRQK